jgi:penicillin-binding protein activator
MKNIWKSFLVLSLIILVSACQTRVTRVDAGQTVDLSGRWNDTDSQQVAQAISQDALNSNWLRESELNDINAKRPVIIIGVIANKSHEHIDHETFTKDIEREFIKSNKIRVLQNKTFREKLREERADQQEFASPETQKKWGRELGADYMMFGNINSIVDQEGKRKVVYYQVNLELTNIETNEIVWIGDKKIKKYVRNF